MTSAVSEILLERRLQDYESACHQKRQGLNRSFQREVIFKVLASTDSHPTAEELFEVAKKQVPTLSLGTVYKNLTLLQELGLVRDVKSGKGSVRYDANMEPHYHFICSSCHSMEDLPSELGQVPSHHPSLEGHLVQGVELAYHGVCRHCLANGVIPK